MQRTRRHDKRRHRTHVHLPLLPFAIEALRDRLELAWALTVHESQGSELDALALIIPAGKRGALRHSGLASRLRALR